MSRAVERRGARIKVTVVPVGKVAMTVVLSGVAAPFEQIIGVVIVVVRVIRAEVSRLIGRRRRRTLLLRIADNLFATRRTLRGSLRRRRWRPSDGRVERRGRRCLEYVRPIAVLVGYVRHGDRRALRRHVSDVTILRHVLFLKVFFYAPVRSIHCSARQSVLLVSVIASVIV